MEVWRGVQGVELGPPRVRVEGVVPGVTRLLPADGRDALLHLGQPETDLGKSIRHPCGATHFLSAAVRERLKASGRPSCMRV